MQNTAGLMPINGVNLWVQVQGQGLPLVMLHGLASNMQALQFEVDELSESFRTIGMDSRGHGRSDKPVSYTLQDHISDVLGVMDALHLDTFNLLGASMGSYIAQGVAIQAPPRIKKLVLITPKASGKMSSSARFLAEHAAELEGKSPEEIQAFLVASIFAPMTSQAIKNQIADVIRQEQAAGLTLTPEQTLAAKRALENFDFRGDLSKITADTLVLSGRYDPLNPVAVGEEIARLIPHARFEILERSGHAPSVEEPAKLMALVKAFLAGPNS